MLTDTATWKELDVNSGEVYKYIGETPLTDVNLGSHDPLVIDYSDTTKWQQLKTSDFEDIFFPNVGNVVTRMPSRSALSIAYNDVRGDRQGLHQEARRSTPPPAT